MFLIEITLKVFYQSLGIVYFFAFFPFIYQIKGLLGEKGILPIPIYLTYFKNSLSKKRFYYIPSIFWINSSDQVLLGTVIAGTILSSLLALGFSPILILPCLYLLYLSIVSTGQIFLGYGWEGFLLEITLNAFILALGPSALAWISINFLLFRFHFYAGAVKLQSRDKSWCSLTALEVHYLTQPIPNTQAWFFDKLPPWFQKLTCIFVFFAELVVPFFLFLNEEMRVFGGICMILLQVMIWVSGNYSYLNYVTISLSLLAFIPFWPLPPFSGIDLLALPLLLAQIARAICQLKHLPILPSFLHYLGPFHIGNRYGIFAVMTTVRYEIIIEGSDDNKEWKEYGFKYKPGFLNKRPKRIAPFQPRLDWQMWFLPFGNWNEEPWFKNFIFALLNNNGEVLKLISYNPFPNNPPKYIRSLVYKYEYTSLEQLRKTGNWWKRTLIGSYSPSMQIKSI